MPWYSGNDDRKYGNKQNQSDTEVELTATVPTPRPDSACGISSKPQYVVTTAIYSAPMGTDASSSIKARGIRILGRFRTRTYSAGSATDFAIPGIRFPSKRY